MLTNAGARPGDAVLLTKPIGTGVIATALKHARAPQAAVDAAIRVMLTLNRAAAEVLQAQPAGRVHACTDVTGFGLIGHAEEMASASGVTVRIDGGGRAADPEGARDLARRNRSGGLATNEAHFQARVSVSPSDRRRTFWRCSTTPRPPAGCSSSSIPAARRRSDRGACRRREWPARASAS